jgi:diguanylate cyclase
MRVPVAVNISLKDLRDVEFAEHIRRLLAHWDVPAKDLTLEFTESCMMGDAERTIDVISRLHALGLKLAIDDFGSGYSSLAYLKRLPIPEIKIDRSFVMDMANDESDAVIVRSTIDLAHNMGLKVIAEGVESQDILDLLAILGCDAAQGYHFARPMPADQIVQWLRERRAA